MRTVLTFLAVFLVAALTAALVAPVFVDWSAQRAFFQSVLSDRLGAPVAISGRIELRLLPTPYVTFEKVSVGSGDPALRAEKATAEVALGGLVAGEFRFTRFDLEKPIIHARLRGNGVEAWKALTSDLARRVSFERLLVSDGQVMIDRDEGTPVTVSHLNLDASAKSLIGPFRGSGSFSTSDGSRPKFEFATTEIVNGSLPIKADLDLGPIGARTIFDGKIALSGKGAVQPSFAGAISISGKLAELEPGAGAFPWKISGFARGDSVQAKVENIDLRLGPEVRALEAAGSLEIGWGASASFVAELQAKAWNLDSLFRREGEDSVSPARVAAVLAKVTPSPDSAKAPGTWRIHVSTPSIFLGAGTLEHVDMLASSDGMHPIQAHFEGDLPGQGRAELTGAWELGAAAAFKGRMKANIGDLRSLGEWMTEDHLDLTKKIDALADALPSNVIGMTGDVEVSSVGFSARDIRLNLDRSIFTGAAAFTRPTSGDHARLFLDLRSDGLDLETAPNLEAAGDWLGDLDLSLSLQASKLRVARVGGSAVEGGRLDFHATKAGAKLTLDKLSLSNLGGASVEAQAESSPAGRAAIVRLDAARLGDFAALVARVAPGHFSRMLVERAEALSPAKASFEARRDGPPMAGVFPLDFVKADGDFGPTHLSMKVSRAPAPVDAVAADFALDSSDAAALLRQAGLKPPKGATTGKAHVVGSGNGKWESGFDASLSASVAGTELTWRGRAQPEPPGADDPRMFGAATVKSDNALNLLSLLGLASVNVGMSAPIDLGGDFVVRSSEVKVTRLAGVVSGAKVAGSLNWRLPEPTIDAASIDADVAVARAVADEAPAVNPARLTGELTTDKTSVSALLASTIGAPAPAKAGAKWSEAKFGPAVVSPPSTDIQFKAAAFDLTDGLPGKNLSARLRIDATKWELADATLDVAGGRANGGFTVRRDGATVATTGRLSCENIALDRPGFRGKVGVVMEFAGTGASPAAIVSGLVGQGQISLAGASIAKLDAGALSRLVVKTDNADALIDETNVSHAFALELDKQALALPDATLASTLSSGVARVAATKTQGPSGQVTTSGEFDLKSFNLDLKSVFEEARGGKFWSGPPPTAIVTVKGALDAPSRKIDVSTLAAGLAAQSIARETDRIANLEADLRERAAFNRRLKAERAQARREAELVAFGFDQARATGEAERRRVEGELLKAYDEKLKSDAAAAAAAAAILRAPEPDPNTPAPAPVDIAPKPKAATVDPADSGIY